MVNGSAGRAGAAGCGSKAPPEASSPARNPASQARWTGLAVPTTLLRRLISSSANGAVFGIGDILISHFSAAQPAPSYFKVWWQRSYVSPLPVTVRDNADRNQRDQSGCQREGQYPQARTPLTRDIAHRNSSHPATRATK